MEIVVIHGQEHKGSTYHLTKLLMDNLSEKADNIKEFYTNDIPPCVGCFLCITKGEEFCPHCSVIAPMAVAIEESDTIIINSPNYCMEMSGQLKTFFDHMAYRWISHRPHPSMKNKIGVAITTTAGAGARGTAKSIARQMLYWNVAKTYCLPFTVAAMDWDSVKTERKSKLAQKSKRIAKKVKKTITKVKPGIKSRFMFNIMRSMQKNSTWNQVDRKHWENNGWI